MAYRAVDFKIILVAGILLAGIEYDQRRRFGAFCEVSPCLNVEGYRLSETTVLSTLGNESV